MHKAIKEIEEVQSPSFINIPSLTYTSDYYPMTTIFDGIRTSSSFAGVRNKLNLHPPYQNNTEDVFVFQDEERYRRYVGDAVRIPVISDIQVRDQQNNSVSLTDDIPSK